MLCLCVVGGGGGGGWGRGRRFLVSSELKSLSLAWEVPILWGGIFTNNWVFYVILTTNLHTASQIVYHKLCVWRLIIILLMGVSSNTSTHE